jgi:hypothetical protein
LGGHAAAQAQVRAFHNLDSLYTVIDQGVNFHVCAATITAAAATAIGQDNVTVPVFYFILDCFVVHEILLLNGNSSIKDEGNQKKTQNTNGIL